MRRGNRREQILFSPPNCFHHPAWLHMSHFGFFDLEARLRSVVGCQKLKRPRHGGPVSGSCVGLQARRLHASVHRTPAWGRDLTWAPRGGPPAGAGLVRPE